MIESHAEDSHSLPTVSHTSQQHHPAEIVSVLPKSPTLQISGYWHQMADEKHGNPPPPPSVGRLLDCDDQTTSLTLLSVFTGCLHLNASSLNWQSLSTEVFTALHLGICLICFTAFQTSHRDAVSGRQPPLNWSSLCHGFRPSVIVHLLHCSITLCLRTLHLRCLDWC